MMIVPAARFLRCGLALFSLTLLVGPARGQELIRWKFKEGETFYVQEKDHTSQKMKIQESLVVQELDRTRVSRFKVLKATPDGGAVLEQKIESVQATPRGNVNQAETSVLRHFQGATFRITLDAHQRVVKVEGFKGLVERVARDNPDAARLLRTVLSEESFRQPLVGLLGFVPEKPMGKGQSWAVKSRSPFGPWGTMEMTDTYTLRGAEAGEKDVVRIDLTSSVTYAPPKEGTGLPFKVISGDLKVQASRGSIFFNRAVGRLVRRELRQNLRGIFTIERGDQRLEIELTHEQTQRATLLDRDPLRK